MRRHPHPDHFDPNCDGCKPVLLNPETGELYPDDHPVVVAMQTVFATATQGELDAYYRVTVKNSRAVSDQVLANGLFRRVQTRITETGVVN